jgi:enoyl-[acyl-carrier protein] reductase I
MPAQATGLHDKIGLIVGVANRRSIAWGIARAAAREGASIVLTYQSERLEENVRELAASLADPLVLPCDVTDEAQLDAVFAGIEARHGRLDFLVHATAFADRQDLERPFVETPREGFHKALDVSTYSLVALARRAVPLMAKAGGGRILTLTYLGSERVFPNYNVMGVAKAALEASVRYLASDLGPRDITVNAISAGPVKTLAASGIAGFSGILQAYRERAPLRRTVDIDEIADAAVMLIGPAGRAITGEVLMVDAGFHAMGI